ncbi:MAG: glycosyltransferase family 4 protein [Candidatus Omnitrophica bacterium]|nr:glycosyltransferase family 4 protein [Candidatus Omnitrophota bacterium]
MKICSIIHAFSPFQFGGADIFAENIVEELSRRGYSQSVISINPLKGDTCERRPGLTVYRFHPMNVSTALRIGKAGLFRQGVWTALDIYSRYSYNKVRLILEKEKPDVVHVHTPPDFTVSVFDALKDLNLPTVFTLQDYFLLCRRVVLLHGDARLCTDSNINPLCKLYRMITRNLTRAKIDIVTSPSLFTLELLKANGFFENCSKYIVPNGINTGDFRRNNGKSKGAITFLYMGGLTRHKGVHILIKAFRRIENPNIRLQIVGRGVYEKALKSLAGDDSRIVFYDNVPHGDTPKFYAAADVLVVPSIWYEVFGRVIVEAFSAGLPVISSDIGGMRELVKDGFNGFLFEPGNIEQLKESLLRIIADEQVLKKLSDNAYASRKEYEFSECVDKFIEIYKEAIRRRAG